MSISSNVAQSVDARMMAPRTRGCNTTSDDNPQCYVMSVSPDTVTNPSLQRRRKQLRRKKCARCRPRAECPGRHTRRMTKSERKPVRHDRPKICCSHFEPDTNDPRQNPGVFAAACPKADAPWTNLRRSDPSRQLRHETTTFWGCFSVILQSMSHSRGIFPAVVVLEGSRMRMRGYVN